MAEELKYHGPFVGKPRMTQRDKWKPRPVVERYWNIKDLMILQAKQQKFSLGERFEITVSLPMPKSWSKKKKKTMAGTPHRQKPDIDNILKSIMDILLPEDSSVYNILINKEWGAVDESEYIIRIWNLPQV